MKSEGVVRIIRQGRVTALMKPTGGVRGIVTGDVFRRLVSRTIAQQLGPAVERATSPFQYALSTRAGCECIGHALQMLTESHPHMTVTSVDGISAYDTMSRVAMMSGIAEVDPGVLPFVQLFDASPTKYVWEDNAGVTHTITQSEGANRVTFFLMSLLYSLGQHQALVATMAYLDDIYLVTSPTRVGAVYTTLSTELQRRCHIRVHTGKTRVWNAAGVRPDACDWLERQAVLEDAGPVWRGSDLSTFQQRVRILGTPLGHPDFVRA